LTSQITHVEHRTFKDITFREGVALSPARIRHEVFFDIDMHRSLHIAEAAIAHSHVCRIDCADDIDPSIETTNFKPNLRRLHERIRGEVGKEYSLIKHQLATSPKDRRDINFYRCHSLLQ